MLFKMPKISFFLRSDKNAQKTRSLYCRVTCQKSTTEFSLKEKIAVKNWCQKSQKMKGASDQAKYVNALISSTQYNIKTFAISNDYTTARELVKKLNTCNKPSKTMVELVNEYIDHVAPKLKPGTLRNHKIKLQNLLDYQKYSGITFYSCNFTLPEAEKFKIWFMDRAKTDNVTTASRNILFYRKALQLALKMGEIEPFPLLNFQGEKDPIKKAVFLTLEELTILDKFCPENKQLKQIKDLFLFQCYTGISFGDIWGDWRIKKYKDEFIIFGTRSKNGQAFYVPLSTNALAILEKYAMKLPKYCNAPYNRILKEIAVLCNIEKRITSHTARKTFATVQDGLGWSRESIARMLGHKKISTTEDYYLGESEIRVLEELRMVG